MKTSTFSYLSNFTTRRKPPEVRGLQTLSRKGKGGPQASTMRYRAHSSKQGGHVQSDLHSSWHELHAPHEEQRSSDPHSEHISMLPPVLPPEKAQAVAACRSAWSSATISPSISLSFL
jgi:hypothetical protein